MSKLFVVLRKHGTRREVLNSLVGLPKSQRNIVEDAINADQNESLKDLIFACRRKVGLTEDTFITAFIYFFSRIL